MKNLALLIGVVSCGNNPNTDIPKKDPSAEISDDSLGRSAIYFKLGPFLFAISTFTIICATGLCCCCIMKAPPDICEKIFDQKPRG